MKTSLSVLVPVYNEQHLVFTSLQRLKTLDQSQDLERIEVIVVDDCSTDESPGEIERFSKEQTRSSNSKLEWIFIRHEKNRGKGQAVKTALARATCEISVIHDADLEYHPKDLHRMIRVFIDEEADAVYGSRFAGSEVRRVLFFRHELGNKLLTFLCNLVTNLNLTDMETCYKAIRTQLLKSIPIESNDFRIEPELTIKLAKRGARIFEVPISYSGRTYEEGKKINWHDGLRALYAIIKFTLSDGIYAPDRYGSQILTRLVHAPKFNAWIGDQIRHHCGNRVLEIGSGLGLLTRHLTPRFKYVASDVNPIYLERLKALSSDRPYLRIAYCDITDIASFPHDDDGYDTVVCSSVIEHVNDDALALAHIRSALAPGGRAVLVVPQGQWNFGTLDSALGHRRRYSKQCVIDLATKSGFGVSQIREFNRVSTPAWFINGKILKRTFFGRFQIWILDFLTPLLRVIDAILPFPGLSLVVVLERPADSG